MRRLFLLVVTGCLLSLVVGSAGALAQSYPPSPTPTPSVIPSASNTPPPPTASPGPPTQTPTPRASPQPRPGSPSERPGADPAPSPSGSTPGPATSTPQPQTGPGNPGGQVIVIDGRGGASGGQPRVELGETITLRGSGWLPFSSIDIVIRSTPRRLATVVTDAAGSFEVAVTVPRGMAPGGHTLHLTGVDASGHPRAESIPVVVVASAGGVARGLPVGARNSEGGLANTGIPVGGALLLIGVLLSGGTALLLLARRRQLAQTPLVDD